MEMEMEQTTHFLEMQMEQKETFVDVFFSGSLTTVTPFTFTSPSKKDGKLPLIAGKLYIPASSIRGKLRRLARDEIQDSLAEAGGEHRFSLPDFYLNTLGGVKGAKGAKGGDAKEDKGETVRVFGGRKKNPLVSLFGAMAPSNVPGKLMIDHAIDNGAAAAEPITISHVRSDDISRDPSSVLPMLEDGFEAEYLAMGKVMDARSAANRDIKALRAQLKKVTDEGERERILKEINAAKEVQDDNTAVQVQQILEYQAIPPGLKLNSNFRLLRVTKRELVLFLRALNRFSANPVLGGRHNHGNGIVSGEWDVRIRASGTLLPAAAGTVRIAGDFGPAEVTGEIAELMSATLDLDGCDFSAKVFEQEAA